MIETLQRMRKYKDFMFYLPPIRSPSFNKNKDTHTHTLSGSKWKTNLTQTLLSLSFKKKVKQLFPPTKTKETNNKE